MQAIPEPELLDPNRPLPHERDDFAMLDHRSQAERLKAALDGAPVPVVTSGSARRPPRRPWWRRLSEPGSHRPSTAQKVTF